MEEDRARETNLVIFFAIVLMNVSFHETVVSLTVL